MSSNLPPAGWFPDPDNNDNQRYWDGSQWTDHFAPKAAPSAPPQTSAPYPTGNPGTVAPRDSSPQAGKKPWYTRWWAIALGVLLVIIVIGSFTGGSEDSSGTAGSGAGSSSDASASGGQSKASKPKSSVKAKSGLDAEAGKANVVRAGSGFQLGDFKIQSGWKVKNLGYGLGYSIENLSVQNTTSDSHTFDVEFKLRDGSRISADISCIANEASPKDIVEVDCFPDGSGKAYKTITVENSF